MEHIAIFEEQVALTPKDMRTAVKSIDTLLEGKLKARLESRCSRHGYVVPNTLKIISRSMGAGEKGRFTGNFLFQVQSEGKVLNPPDGVVVEGEVIRKNKMGLYVNYNDAIRIIVPRDVNIGNDEFESVEVGEIVKVEIKKSRFQVNDEYILSVGLFKGLGTGAVRRRKENVVSVASPATEAPAAEEELDEEDEEEEEGEETNEEEEDENDEENTNEEGEETNEEEDDEEEEDEEEGKEAEGKDDE